jgi:hypothetical protein
LKQLIVTPIIQFVILATLVFSQFVFAGDLIGKRDFPTIQTVNSSSCSGIEFAINDVTIDIVGTDLMINFNSPIGVASVSIKDSKGDLVYQSTVDTEITADLSLPTSLFNKGNYTVFVTYDSSVYTEQIHF